MGSKLDFMQELNDIGVTTFDQQKRLMDLERAEFGRFDDDPPEIAGPQQPPLPQSFSNIQPELIPPPEPIQPGQPDFAKSQFEAPPIPEPEGLIPQAREFIGGIGAQPKETALGALGGLARLGDIPLSIEEEKGKLPFRAIGALPLGPISKFARGRVEAIESDQQERRAGIKEFTSETPQRERAAGVTEFAGKAAAGAALGGTVAIPKLSAGIMATAKALGIQTALEESPFIMDAFREGGTKQVVIEGAIAFVLNAASAGLSNHSTKRALLEQFGEQLTTKQTDELILAAQKIPKGKRVLKSVAGPKIAPKPAVRSRLINKFKQSEREFLTKPPASLDFDQVHYAKIQRNVDVVDPDAITPITELGNRGVEAKETLDKFIENSDALKNRVLDNELASGKAIPFQDIKEDWRSLVESIGWEIDEAGQLQRNLNRELKDPNKKQLVQEITNSIFSKPETVNPRLLDDLKVGIDSRVQHHKLPGAKKDTPTELITKELNDKIRTKLRTEVSDDYMKALDRDHLLITHRDYLNKRLGSQIDPELLSDAKNAGLSANGASMAKSALQSPSGGQLKSELETIAELTGIDLIQESRYAQNAMIAGVDPRINSLLQMPNIAALAVRGKPASIEIARQATRAAQLLTGLGKKDALEELIDYYAKAQGRGAIAGKVPLRGSLKEFDIPEQTKLSPELFPQKPGPGDIPTDKAPIPEETPRGFFGELSEEPPIPKVEAPIRQVKKVAPQAESVGEFDDRTAWLKDLKKGIFKRIKDPKQKAILSGKKGGALTKDTKHVLDLSLRSIAEDKEFMTRQLGNIGLDFPEHLDDIADFIGQAP